MASPSPSFSLSSTIPLLSPPPPPPRSAMLVAAGASLLVAAALLFVSTSTAISQPAATNTVILISSDAFRFGYQHKAPLPAISRLIAGGTEAAAGLIPVFPTLTFPNHYSIATGLYPDRHGIVLNHFVDPATGAVFSMDSHDPHWWLGEPIWATAARHGLTAATYYWPGSEVVKGPWSCPALYCHHYNKSVPYASRVDSVLSYFDLPASQVPSLITLYFEEPDLKGHLFGPDHPDVTAAVQLVDSMLARLIRGLEDRGLFPHTTLIFVGDHGMVGVCESKYVSLDDLDLDPTWVASWGPLFALRPPPDVSPADVVRRLNARLGGAAGNVENGDRLRFYLKEDLPERLHYRASERIPPVIGMLDEGYRVVRNRTGGELVCGGDHGYDNAFFSMRTVFVGHGPRFAKGRKVPSFENVEIYNVIANILNLKGAPNNGSAAFPDSILLPPPPTAA